METQRLGVRLDTERHRRLQKLAEEANLPVSALVRRLIDDTYEGTDLGRRMRAARAIGQMEIEGVPDPDELSRQLEETYEPGGLDGHECADVLRRTYGSNPPHTDMRQEGADGDSTS